MPGLPVRQTHPVKTTSHLCDAPAGVRAAKNLTTVSGAEQVGTGQ